ncbi:hypothetical protein SUS17_3932 [Sphingomonas sp. S17]|jgi:pimeloyl-ACP methyl ester carboxylesterase|uniref:Alpha/beta fold hydrolase n=2 Tax=Sphingomonas paucimobilis TaxID=13689 RepID=A0A7Y2KRE2_SPHPI|nr:MULTISPECIES: alpha/beta fold hydrolase [Sphingomonas]EGI53261.1 hypothetical protein SUS17_3932 [Sphingomonas sp. S17]MBQ1480934.1 alpha/beta fold hydrolase [Sphingomonas sp.]MCM3680068.1 alpha/beta hydrolase [Sphingomonas paucimobilis]MDG5970534.1 alpha/beta fold hydrolase [Sphingomonas paucimobilis]NNG58782.1 alpha/beta fold hydrolase [Sphingomonas paucimobilis]
MVRHSAIFPIVLLASASIAQQAPNVFQPSAVQTALQSKARAAGATELAAAAAPNGGMILNGSVEGRRFVLTIPPNWTGETVLFGQGYALPGTPPTVPADPLAKDPGGGLFNHLYAQGIASGIAAVDKNGIATETATRNTMRLRALAAKLGATRFYAVGGSMGGNIVLSLIENHPNAFSGAVAMCGVTQGWLAMVRQLTDMRGAYDVLTEGTPYALPGGKDLTRSALPIVPPANDPTPGDAFREAQKMKLLSPILTLFLAAKANPQGSEARIIRQVAAVGGFAPDPAALGAPISSAALGMDDIKATMGGLPIGNRDIVYAPPEMDATQTAAFNRKMQRYDADPRAVAYARRWHEATGRFRIPLVTVHQTIDSLVPFAQSEGLGRITAAAGNGARLAQYAVPPTTIPLPGGLTGYTHCGFTPVQNIAAFDAMRTWVRTGRKPAAEAVR